MAASLRIYIQGDTPIHRADARVKLVLLLLFSVGVFFVGTWRGLGVYSLAVAAVVVAGRMPLARLGALSLPLVVLLAFIWVCNAFTFDVGSLAESGIGGVSAGFAEGWQPVALAGTFGFVPQGCMFALFYAVRILLVGELRRFVYHIRRSVDGCFCVTDATSARHSRSRRRCGHHALPCSSVYPPYRRGIGVGTQRPNGARRTVGKRQYLAAPVRLPHGIYPLGSALVSPRRHFKRFHGGALLWLRPANQP